MTGNGDLLDAWAIVRNQPIFYRRSEIVDGRRVLVHLHGFAISGSYMVPTARLLVDEFTTFVPDLPGFGRSLNPDHVLTIDELADSVAAFLDQVGVDRATLVGNSLGCAILASFAHRHPDRLDRVVLVSPAGGVHSRPLPRAIGQLLLDAPREPMSMAAVAVPDYLRFGVVPALKLFHAMTKFPAVDHVLELDVSTLAVLGTRDPLLPPVSRVREMAGLVHDGVRIVVIKDAAHAINFSHPRELSAVIRQFMDDRPVLGAIDVPGAAPVAELHTAGKVHG
jgi:pimeloyl-ACP methyl ester carboxylesterase